MEIVRLMLERGATWYNGGLYGACIGGHMEIVMLMLERGATHYNGGLDRAFWGDHREIILLLLEYTTKAVIPVSYTFTQDEVAHLYHKGFSYSLTRKKDKEALQKYLTWKDSAKGCVNDIFYADIVGVVMGYL